MVKWTSIVINFSIDLTKTQEKASYQVLKHMLTLGPKAYAIPQWKTSYLGCVLNRRANK